MDETQKMRKRNMKLFPTYKNLAWDYLFYYTIDFLFLTQVKNISVANVVLANSFKHLFGVFLQLPANIIVEFLGRKNSIILGNILNCLYMVMFMMTGNIFDLILAKFISCLAISIKEIAEPSLLNSSIPPSKYKSNIFAKLNGKGASRYYLLGAISKVIAGFLFGINGYIPLICSLIVLILVSIMSLFFIEPVKKHKSENKTDTVKTQIKDIKEGFRFILKSERLKALILATAFIKAFLSIVADYRTSLLQEIGTQTYIITLVSAILSFSSSIASRKQEMINNKFKNKTITIMALTTSISILISGILGLKAKELPVLTIIIILLFILAKFAHGLFFTIMDRYFRNFTNKDIDTKIFATKNLIVNLVSSLIGIISSFLLDKMSTAYCMIISGIVFTIIYILIGIYMKTRVGLKPEEYSKQERKYDELKDEE